MAKKTTTSPRLNARWKRWASLQLASWLPQNQRDAFEILEQVRAIITRLPAARKVASAPRSRQRRADTRRA